MTDTHRCIDKELLVDYLYGEAGEDVRRGVEAHLRGCATCAGEVGELRDVRSTLGEWVPPEPELGFRVVSEGERAPTPATWGQRLRRPAWWGLAAAAVLVLAAAAAVANLEVRVGSDGMVVRTGWGERAAPVAVSPADLDSLGEELRREMRTLVSDSASVPTRTAGPSSAADPWLQNVERMIQDSEQRQRRVLDSRVQEAEQRIASQRRSDLVEMERTFRAVDAEDAEIARQQLLEYMRRIATR